jgi:RNA polymerase sigma-54 factor
MEPALAVLRSLEPRGLGGRDAIDAMLLQVPPDDPDRSDICALLTEHLADLAANRLPAVARQMRLDVADVLALCARIRALDPRPGARFHGGDLPRIRPDLVVVEAGDRLEVAVEDHALPDLGLNGDYTALLAGPHTPPEVRRYLSGKLSAARDLIHAIEQRRRTLARVGAAVMQHQREFLRWGEAALRPLRMADIAARLGLHTSTVSRAVAGKHVQTCRGIHALRAFFDGAAAGGGCGRRRVLRQLQELVAAEDPQRPLSDDDLVSLLAALSIPVARRTVAKYRKELGLLPSWRRKSHRG